MKVIKSLFLVPVLFTLTAITLNAARIYVVYDPECMDRLEYNYYKDGNTGVYVAYHVRLSASERIVLEIGREDGIEQDRLPAGVVNCSNGLFDRQTVKRINNKSDELIIVYPTLNRRYIMMPVRIAAIHQWDGKVISYSSPTYSFRFDTREGAVGENISYNNPNVQVYFEGRIANECSGAYIFRQYTNATGVANAYSEIVIAPEIGITEARSGLTPEDATNNVVVLERVNNRKFSDHLLLACGKGTPPPATVDNSGPSGYDYTGTKGSTGSTSGTGNTTTTATTHTVQQGETLYAISKKYGVSVKQIQDWNKMGKSTAIRRGQQLQVNVTSTETTVPSSFENNTPRFTPKNGTVQTGATTSGSYFTVKSGETIGYLAQKYGYTEKRFREFNNLGENDWIKVGQRLKSSDCECPQTTSQSTGMKSYDSSGERLYPKGNIQPANNSGLKEQEVRTSSYYNYSYNQPSQQNLANMRSGGEAEIRPSAYSVYDSPIVMPAQQEQANQNGMQFYDDAPLPISTEASTVPQTVRNSNTKYDFSERTTPLIYDAQPNNNTAAATNYANDGSLPQNYETGVSKNYHVVQAGENLYRIAKQYGLTVQYLRRINNMSSDDVYVNQRIALK